MPVVTTGKPNLGRTAHKEFFTAELGTRCKVARAHLHHSTCDTPVCPAFLLDELCFSAMV